jgi:hypothetical protein
VYLKVNAHLDKALA